MLVKGRIHSDRIDHYKCTYMHDIHMIYINNNVYVYVIVLL